MVEIDEIHQALTIIHGSLTEELTEQKLSCKYIRPDDVVLEIGGNMGRNALVVSKILNDASNLVTMEPNKQYAQCLKKNRDHNGLNFHIEPSALSIDKLYTHGAITFKNNSLEKDFPNSCNHINPENALEASVIDFESLVKKYNKQFNVLCVDCEGAFYYILKEMGGILNGIKLLIIENDYENIEHYNFVKDTLRDRNFECVEELPLLNPPWPAPCKDFFYQVWKKTLFARFPINFSIPQEKITLSNTKKTKVLSNLIPGDPSTYIFENESEYYEEYQSSLFALTKMKGGWDCLRHYEILACNCIPYFENLHNCPNNTLTLLPKSILYESNKLYDTKFKNNDLSKISNDDIDLYNNYRSQLFEYTKEYLTTDKIAEYILAKTNNKDIKSVLFMSGDPSPDYLRCLTLHGFKTKFESKCHDFPKIAHLYKSDTINYKRLYGKGFTYTNLLDQSYHCDICDASLLDDISQKKYDIIIYGSYHRGMPYYELASKAYDPHEIILLCGEDFHNCNYNFYVQKGHYVFVRELL